MSWYQHAVLVAYLAVLTVVAFYGLHRYALMYLYYKHRDKVPCLQACFREWPRVTVQLPMYNERFVARRVIEHACALDYPQDRLQIQVLDDSTDQTTEIVRQAVKRLRAGGHDIELLHRTQRHGYKAGALQAGMALAKGELVCILDADFLPAPGLLRETVHYFTDPSVGMVQARWEHLNRDDSLLTKAQAVLLDGHFILEHGSRCRSGRFMSFNGTAGIWRRSAIEDSGGWQHDTLTEDLDLSYRAQLRGWKFLFLPSTEVPAELPPEINAFKAQQFRWTKGGAQTCRKLLPAVMRSAWSWPVKLEAFFHLTSNVVYGFVVLLTLLMFPAVAALQNSEVLRGTLTARLISGSSILLLATLSAGSFYACSQRELGRGWWESIKYIPALMGLGIGIAVNNAWAMFQGYAGVDSEFVRTPKYGAHDNQARAAAGGEYKARGRTWQLWLETLLGVYMLICAGVSVRRWELSIGTPFLLLFAAGYLAVGLSTARSRMKPAVRRAP
jgi:cellulose synthase/poly-beta-1,6-N-acetylglucosamine synthase-like glycosyltransferase